MPSAKKLTKRRKIVRASWKEKLLAELRRMTACRDAVKYVIASKCTSFSELWDTCQRADWMLWLAAQKLDRKIVVRAACACARTALLFVPAGEDRPRLAIETAERWCDGKATLDEVRAAAYAAYYAAAYAAAYAAFAAFAAYADYAAYADSAPSAAAAAAAYDDTDGNKMKALSAIVRTIIPSEAFASK